MEKECAKVISICKLTFFMMLKYFVNVKKLLLISTAVTIENQPILIKQTPKITMMYSMFEDGMFHLFINKTIDS